MLKNIIIAVLWTALIMGTLTLYSSKTHADGIAGSRDKNIPSTPNEQDRYKCFDGGETCLRELNRTQLPDGTWLPSRKDRNYYSRFNEFPCAYSLGLPPNYPCTNPLGRVRTYIDIEEQGNNGNRGRDRGVADVPEPETSALLGASATFWYLFIYRRRSRS